VDCISQKTENMVVRTSQIRAVRWMRQESPLKICDGLSGMQTCVWPRIVVVKKHFCRIFMGTNPPETHVQSFHIDIHYKNHPFTARTRDIRHIALSLF
jgi:hypothetical protein